MSTLGTVRKLVLAGDWVISRHARERMQQLDVSASELRDSIHAAAVVEDYPDAQRGPSLLTLQRDALALPIHVVWGLPAGIMRPATVITVYRPDPAQWTPDFLGRRS